MFVCFDIFAFVLGLVLGSFYNVCIHRYLTGKSIVLPASHCPECEHKLSWWENIPLISFMILRGKCRSCGQKISLRYPVVELISGLLTLGLALKFGSGVIFFVYLFFFGLLIVASFIDLDSFILPDIITLHGGILALAASFILPISWQDAFLGAVLGSGSFWVLQKGYKLLKGIDGLGTGDVKLMFMLGALLGWQGLPVMVFIAALTGLMASLYYLKRDKSKGTQTRIPFGPFLSLGTVICILAGDVVFEFVF
jgi:leader peptidase (prepilin peptidase)/N-methyltransferase